MTDTERLDWLKKNAWPDKIGEQYVPHRRKVFPFRRRSIREAIDALAEYDVTGARAAPVPTPDGAA